MAGMNCVQFAGTSLSLLSAASEGSKIGCSGITGDRMGQIIIHLKLKFLGDPVNSFQVVKN